MFIESTSSLRYLFVVKISYVTPERFHSVIPKLFQVCCHSVGKVHWMAGPRCCLVYKLRYTHLTFRGRHLGFTTPDFLPVWLYEITKIPIGLLDLKNCIRQFHKYLHLNGRHRTWGVVFSPASSIINEHLKNRTCNSQVHWDACKRFLVYRDVS